MSAKTPVFLLTGFLGSGKTTLLNAALREPAMFTQQRAPISSARARRSLQSASAESRCPSSGLMGLLQAPTSAITRSASSAARA